MVGWKRDNPRWLIQHLWSIYSEPGTVTSVWLFSYAVDFISISQGLLAPLAGHKPSPNSPQGGWWQPLWQSVSMETDVKLSMQNLAQCRHSISYHSLLSTKDDARVSKLDLKGDGMWSLKGPRTSKNLSEDTTILIASDDDIWGKNQCIFHKFQTAQRWKQLPREVENKPVLASICICRPCFSLFLTQLLPWRAFFRLFFPNHHSLWILIKSLWNFNATGILHTACISALYA